MYSQLLTYFCQILYIKIFLLLYHLENYIPKVLNLMPCLFTNNKHQISVLICLYSDPKSYDWGKGNLVQKVNEQLPRVAAVLQDFVQDSFPQKQVSAFLEPGA